MALFAVVRAPAARLVRLWILAGVRGLLRPRGRLFLILRGSTGVVSGVCGVCGSGIKGEKRVGRREGRKEGRCTSRHTRLACRWPPRSKVVKRQLPMESSSLAGGCQWA